MIHLEPDNNDIIQLFYHILLMAGSLRKHDNHYNILKNGFTAAEIMQPIEPIAIVHTLSLFDPLKVISTAFCIGFCGFNIGCLFLP